MHMDDQQIDQQTMSTLPRGQGMGIHWDFLQGCKQAQSKCGMYD